MTLILGIDPGLQHTGWGLIDANKNQLRFIACGTIHSKVKEQMPLRLKALHDGLADIIGRYTPDEAALEETFVNMNGTSTLKLGQARGAIMLSLSLGGLPVHEYAATLVKKTVVGVGRAEKSQIAMMVRTLLPASQPHLDSADAADALAVAICHANHRNTPC